MNFLPLFLAPTGFALLVVLTVFYFRAIPRGTVSKKVGTFRTGLLTGAAFCLIGLVFGIAESTTMNAMTYVTAIVGLFVSVSMLWLLTQRRVPEGDLKIVVGDPLIAFDAKFSDGSAFNTNEFANRRILLKFYRGGWCPYCSAELETFNGMIEDLAAFDVHIYALSKDDPQNAKLHKSRDGIEFDLLSDPDLNVIRAYGLEHQKAFGQTKNSRFKIGGIPFGLAPFVFRSMAIPTTVLIDEMGIIQWIDQTDDYRIRSNAARVLHAVETAFEGQPKRT